MMSGLELHEACTLGDYDTLEELLKTGRYDLDMKDSEWQDRTPIHWACSKGYVDCLRLLVEYGADPLSRMSMGWTPAHCAAESGKLNILRALHGAEISVTEKDQYGDSPKRVAETYGHTECVKYLAQVEMEAQDVTCEEEAPNKDDENDTDIT